MSIPEGTQAMMAWAKIMEGELSEADAEKTKTDLLAYCKLDTFAMFRIWQEVLKLI
jgi:hypothetical protein